MYASLYKSGIKFSLTIAKYNTKLSQGHLVMSKFVAYLKNVICIKIKVQIQLNLILKKRGSNA